MSIRLERLVNPSAKIYKTWLQSLLDHVDGSSSDKKSTSTGEHDTYKEKLFIDGEADGSQTEFERKSNFLHIGVKATQSDRQGYVMLCLLRCIIDEHPWLPLSYIFDADKFEDQDEIDVSLDEACDILANGAHFQHATVHALNGNSDQVISRQLQSADGEFTISKKVRDIDIWTCDRIRNKLETWKIGKC